MVMEELLMQVTMTSLMDNGKMERDMDTIERFIKMVSAGKKNDKMVSL